MSVTATFYLCGVSLCLQSGLLDMFMMLKLENALKGVTLQPGEARECRTLIEGNDNIKVHVSPGHVFLSYGQQALDNIQSYDVMLVNEPWPDRQTKVKKSYLKLKNLQSPILDLIFPSCCSNPVLWVVLRNGTVFIWSFIKSSSEGPRWVPTGQFYIVDTSENTRVTLESIIIHKRSNTLLWCETMNKEDKFNIKKMSLPSDIMNINCNSNIPGVSTVLQEAPKCKLYSIEDSVIFDFQHPCPPGIICSWQYQHRVNILRKEPAGDSWQCIWKLNCPYESVNFTEVAMKISRFWFTMEQPVDGIFACMELRDNAAVIVLKSGLVLRFSNNGQNKKLFEIQNFDMEHVKGCFIYMRMLCCVFKKGISMYDLDSAEKIESIDLYPSVKDVFNHNCCIKYGGIILEDGNILKLCVNNPMALFKSRSKHSAVLLNCLNQPFFELLVRLHQIVVNKDFSEDNIEMIIKHLSSPSIQNESVVCMIKQMLRINNICFEINREKTNDSVLIPILDRSQQSLMDCYKDLDEFAKQVIEKSA